MTSPDHPTDPRADLKALATRGIDWAGRTGRIPRRTAGLVRPAAVLVLFGVLDDVLAQTLTPTVLTATDRENRLASRVPSDLDVLLVERASTLSHHPGQVAFPGGRIDHGDSGPVAAALREAYEETGVEPDGIEVLGALASLPLAVSNHDVTPVLGWWSAPSPVRVVDHGESAHVFRAPVADLLNPANRVTATMRRDVMTHKSPAFLTGGHLIWGFTGIVLDALFTELGWTRPWNRDKEHPING